MNARALAAASLTLALAACGGGGGSSLAPVGGSAGGGGGSSTTQSATVSIAFTTPKIDPDVQSTSSSTSRKPAYISPGLDKLTLIVDGTKLLNAVELDTLTDANGNSTGTTTSGNTSVSFSVTATGDYYTYVATLDTLPGKHTFGIEILGGSPAIILSEAQQTYTLQPGPNTAQSLTLQGVLSSFYIECANGPVDATNCASSFVANSTPGSGGTYTLTAIGADFEGFPISNQANVGFDNGGFTVVETDGNNILTLSNAGPYTSPGSALTGPSGGFYVGTSSTYGQSFNAVCNKLGTATVGLTNAQNGPTTPLTGETYSYYNPSSSVPSSGNYPGSGTLALGTKTPGNPNYHNGSNPNAVTNLATVSCDANLSLTFN